MRKQCQDRRCSGRWTSGEKCSRPQYGSVCAQTLLWLSVILQLHGTDCKDCYSCTDVNYMESCHTVIKCPPGQSCYKDVHASKYTLGCRESVQCPKLNSTVTSSGGAGSLVGRSTSQANCSQCCETDMCNRQLCQATDLECQDSGHIDCATTGQFVEMCRNTDHAKKECRRFCGLCSMVDGGWSVWSTWSSCSTSCGNGTSTRSRSCSNPAPVDGGANCAGNNHEAAKCSNDKCPVNGGWSTWTSWGSCSVSCGIGMQRRDRSCSHPYPSISGFHCFGDARDDRVCLPGACQDGGWSVWGSWGTCSQTCDVCTQTRSRSCTNPSPSKLGRYCTGNSMDVKTNFIKSCVDGGWSVWGSWATCSQTCDVCTQTRSRSCTNPSPSKLGRYCTGNSMDVRTKLIKSCVDQDIGFLVHTPKNTGTTGHISFTTVVTNKGEGYNTTTGKFTCKVAGLYAFSLTLLKEPGKVDTICEIFKNTQWLGKAAVAPDASLGGYFSASTTVYVHLLPGDKVYLQSCSPASNMRHSYETSFSGYLIHMD